MHNHKIFIEYDGTNFVGWQQQENGQSIQSALQAALFKLTGEKITIFDKGEFFRDLIYIDDVISGIKKIMNKGKAGNLYWISSNKKTWFYQLGKWLGDLSGSQVKFVETPKYTKKVDVGNFVVDNSKLRDLGWSPKVSVKEGILKTLDYFKVQNL